MTNDELLSMLLPDARPEQREAITSVAPLTVVSAGAGTGKTFTLAARYAWLLASDPSCSASQILTLTFTQAAAEEMRERIRSTLIAWLARAPEELAHLAAAIEHIDEAYISTIHSFAGRVIRESGLDIEVDPSSTVAADPFKRRAWERFAWMLRSGRYEAAAEMAGDGADAFLEAAGREAVARVCEYYGDTLIAELASAASDVFGSMNMTPADLMAMAEDDAYERIAEMLSDRYAPIVDDRISVWRDVIFPAMDDAPTKMRSQKFFTAVKEVADAWRDRPTDDLASRTEFFLAMMNGPLSKLPGNGSFKDLIVDAIGEPLTSWRDARKPAAAILPTLRAPFFSDDERESCRALICLACIGWMAWEEAKRRAGVLTFSDQITWAGRVLRGSASYASRFRHVVIDEFQDTDGVQDEMIRSLTSSWEDASGRTLFIVGDIKQSIYRFRNADPTLFAGYIEEAKARDDARHIEMSRSFRMNGVLMRDVNTVFSTIWRDGVVRSPMRHDYAPLTPPSDAPTWDKRQETAPQAPLEIIVCGKTAPDEGDPATEVLKPRATLARAVARRIGEMVRGGSPIWHNDAVRAEPAIWSDFAVLVPLTKYYQPLLEAFDAFKIPAVFSSSRDYYSRGEVRDVIALLRACGDAKDELSLTSWIESPFSGMSHGTAVSLIKTARSSRRSLEDVWADASPEAYAEFARLRRLARLRAPSDAVLSLLERPHWLGAYPEYYRPRVIANVRRGADLLRTCEAVLGASLISEAAYLDSAMRSASREEEPDADSGDGAVRVMTVHSSKGLEFPVTIVFGMDSTRGRGSKDAARVSRRLGIVPTRLPSEDAPISKMWDDALDAEDAADESRRLMYVAMTRAKEMLICVGETKGDKTSDWLGELLSVSDQNGRPFPIIDVSGETIAPPSVASDEGRARPQSSAGVPLVAQRTRAAKMTASAYSLISWCPAAYRARYRQGLELKWEMPDGDGYGGADLGTLAHRVLRTWDLRAETLASHISPDLDARATERMIRSLPPDLRAVCADRSQMRALCGWLGDAARTRTFDELRAHIEAGRLRREVAFSVQLADTTLVGAIDLYWEDDLGAHIRDWKITPEQSAPDALYDEQLNFYAAAVSMLRGDMPVDVGLIYLRGGKASCEVRRVDDMPSMRARIEDAAERAATGPFDEAVQNCRRCPFVRFCRAKRG